MTVYGGTVGLCVWSVGFFIFLSNVIYFKLLECIVIKFGKFPYSHRLRPVPSFISEICNTK